MIEFFDNETEQGKLLINYPMFESFRDIKNLNDDNYKNTLVSLLEIKNYKKISSERGSIIDINNYTRDNFLSLIKMNIFKANFIVNNSYSKCSYNKYREILSQENIVEAQVAIIKKKRRIFVLNYGIFWCKTL